MPQKSNWRMIRTTSEALWSLRKEILLNSLFISDYRNTFGIDPHIVCDFFDSYVSDLDEEKKQSIPGYDDNRFFDLLPAYDTQENLWNWYCCYEEDPLPVKEEIAT